ncbi:hypothetical protein D3C80_1122130 [compost metagenome]
MDIEVQRPSLAIGQGFEQRDDNLLILAQLKPLSVIDGIAPSLAHQHLQFAARFTGAGQQATGPHLLAHFQTNRTSPARQFSQQPQGQAVAVQACQGGFMHALYCPTQDNLALIHPSLFRQTHRYTTITGLQLQAFSGVSSIDDLQCSSVSEHREVAHQACLLNRASRTFMLIHDFEDIRPTFYRTLSNQSTQNLQSLIWLDTGPEQLEGFGLVQVRQHFFSQLVGIQLLFRYANHPPAGPALGTIANRQSVRHDLVIDFDNPLRPARQLLAKAWFQAQTGHTGCTFLQAVDQAGHATVNLKTLQCFFEQWRHR